MPAAFRRSKKTNCDAVFTMNFAIMPSSKIMRNLAKMLSWLATSPKWKSRKIPENPVKIPKNPGKTCPARLKIP